MAVSKEYLAYVVDQLSTVGEVDPRRLFGGMGFYFGGLFFALIDDDTLFFKVDQQTRAQYEEAGMKGFDPFKDGRQSLGYYAVPASVLEDQDELRLWALQAIEVARRKSRVKKSRPRSSDRSR
jgi:DNA transformation protein